MAITYSLFEKFEVALWAKAHNWVTDDHRVVLVDSSWVVDLVNDDFLDDVDVGDRIGVSATMTGEAISGNGAVSADTLVFTGLSGANIAGFVLYRWSGVESTSELILHATGYDIPPPDPFKIFWGLNGVIFDRG